MLCGILIQGKISFILYIKILFIYLYLQNYTAQVTGFCVHVILALHVSSRVWEQVAQ